MDKYSFLNAVHPSFITELYDTYLKNPDEKFNIIGNIQIANTAQINNWGSCAVLLLGVLLFILIS